jgi:YVTN family beta-propeller protein
VYVGLQDTNEVAVIDAATRTVVKRIGLGTDSPGGLAVNDAETRLYVASNLSNTLIVIDISGSGAAEVGRVTVDDTTISNPSGVIINAAGDKAYVASTTTGNIAEIALDEASNVYTRTATIALGGVQPYGLALSPDGTMLYAASFNGNTRAVKLSDKSITNLTTGNGNLALAVKPDGSKVYAPSNSTDTLFVIDSSVTPNTVLGTTYPMVAGPYGASITPTGNKLYLTMNTSSAGESVKVFDTASNTVTSTIALPSLAKPTSFGNFVGPRLQYTINATNGTNCVISPAGAVAVNDKGRTFTSTATTGTCEVKVDGVSVGQPSAYTFTGVTGNHTIDSSPIAGTFYTVTASWISSVGGYLESTPTGISQSSHSAQFAAGSSVAIKAPNGFKAINWTGACAGTADGATCNLTALAADKTVGATVVLGGGTGPVYNVTKSAYYNTIDEAIAAASSNDVIKVVAAYTGTSVTTAGSATIVTVSGGWSSDFSTQSGFSSIGTTTIVGPGIIADSLVI